MDTAQVYDSILSVTGQLNPQRFGSSEQVQILDTKEIIAAGTQGRYRRSIYTAQGPEPAGHDA